MHLIHTQRPAPPVEDRPIIRRYSSDGTVVDYRVRKSTKILRQEAAMLDKLRFGFDRELRGE